jgi:hypothetical protein
MKRALISIALAATGCATPQTTVRTFHTPSGETAFEVTCKGRRLTPADCYNGAFNTCGGAYAILNQDGTASNEAMRSERLLRFKCKGALPAVAEAPKEDCRVADTWFWQIPRTVCETPTEACDFPSDRPNERSCHRR